MKPKPLPTLRTIAGLLCLLWLLASHASAQVLIQIKTTGSQPFDARALEGVLKTGAPPKPERAPARVGVDLESIVYNHEILTVSLRHILPTDADYVLDWHFFAAPADRKTGGPLQHRGNSSKKITLLGNATHTIKIASPAYKRTDTTRLTHVERNGFLQPVHNTTSTGDKPGGYVIQILRDQKVLAVEASSLDLKRDYTKLIPKQ